MRILLDTHILIWYLEGDEQLSAGHRQLIADPSNETIISIASLWEMAIKVSRGKLSLSRSLAEIVAEVERSTSIILSIEPKHTIQVSQLQFLHKDPFDRMIIAQAMSEDVPVVSTDPEFRKYGVVLL